MADWLPLIGSALDATGGIFGAIASMRNTDQANAINKEYADMQYNYNIGRDEIEDARYADETAYNRAFIEGERDYNRAFAENERTYQRQWAQEERDYNRALQQQIFNREDTAITRQANELSKLGINPLSASMNGLGSGSVVSSSPSGSSTAPASMTSPSASARGGKSNPTINFTNQLYDFSHLVNAISSVAKGVEGALTGTYQRDAMQLQNDAQFLANLERANDLGIEYHVPKRMLKSSRVLQGKISTINGEKPFIQSQGWKSYGNLRQKNNNIHAIDSYLYDTDDEKTRFIKNLANGDFIGIANNLLDNLKYTISHLGDLKDSMKDLFNPINK